MSIIENEIWKQIINYENYEVSNTGKIRNSKTQRILLPYLVNGYECIKLCKEDKRKHFRVHRLVAYAFITNTDENKTTIDHIDNNRRNNNMLNLRYATPSENNSNRLKSKNRTSIYKGVCYDKSKKKYVGTIRNIHLGYFKDEIECAKAYDNKAKELFGVYARLNFP